MLPLVLSALLALVALSGPASGQQATTVAQRAALYETPTKQATQIRSSCCSRCRATGRSLRMRFARIEVGMGEGNRRKQAILSACPNCIYCGGNTLATTVEHMPPRMMFAGKQRPPGLEFAACKGCNHGSSHADLVASLMSRFTFGTPHRRTNWI